METRPNGRDTPSAAAVLAGHEEEPRDAVARQCGVEGAAHLAGDVFCDVLAQQRLDVLGDELAANHQAFAA